MMKSWCGSIVFEFSRGGFDWVARPFVILYQKRLWRRPSLSALEFDFDLLKMNNLIFCEEFLSYYFIRGFINFFFFFFFFSPIMHIVIKTSSTWYDPIKYWLLLKAVLRVCTPWWSNAGTKFPVGGRNSLKSIHVWFSGVIRAVAVTKQIRPNCHITCYISRIFIINCIAIQAFRIMSSIKCEQRSYNWSLRVGCAELISVT